MAVFYLLVIVFVAAPKAAFGEDISANHTGSTHDLEESSDGQSTDARSTATTVAAPRPTRAGNSYYWRRRERESVQFLGKMVKIIPPLSLVSNLCSLLVFLQRKRRSQNIGLVMIALAIADAFALTLKWSELVLYWTGDVGLHFNKGLCELVYYVTSSARACSSWYILLFTSERFISVAFPLQRARLLSKGRLRLALAAISAACFLSQTYTLVLLEYRSYSPRARFCTYKRKYGIAYFNIFRFLLRETLGFMLPAFVTAALNVGIIVKMRQYSVKRAGLEGGGKEADSTRGLTLMLVTVSSWSISLYTPFVLHQIYFGLLSHRTARDFTFRNYLTPIGLLNYSANFFFYCLGGSQFRREFLSLITCGLLVGPAKGEQSVRTVSSSIGSPAQLGQGHSGLSLSASSLQRTEGAKA